MNRLFFLVFLFFAFFVKAQTTDLNARFVGYKSKKINLYLYDSFGNPEYFSSKQTDRKGQYSEQIPQDYQGYLLLQLNSGQKIKLLHQIGENISFTYSKENENAPFLDLEGETNKLYLQLVQADQVTPELFEKINQNSLLNYIYNLAVDLTRVEQGAIDQKTMNIYRNRLINDGSYLEASGKINNLLLNYYRVSAALIKTKDKESHLKKITDQLLEELIYETPRGQLVLQSAIELFKDIGYTDLSETYLKKAKEITCTDSQLNKRIHQQISLKEGAKAPDYTFIGTWNSTTTENKISDFDTSVLLVFYASWCGHCQNEMPRIESLSKAKKDSIKVIAVSLDDDREAYLKFIEGSKVSHYTELMGWDSSIAQKFNIEGTPTLFLLDKDLTIRKISHSIEVIKNYLEQ